MKNIPKNHFELESVRNSKILCGIDEVGRGSLSGPIVTAAAIIISKEKNSLIQDSKLLPQKKLEKAYDWLLNNSIFAVSIIDHHLIDSRNIYKATQVSMCRAYYQLCSITHPFHPTITLVDAMPLQLPCEVISIVRGESESISIAAASIIAKVTRDRIMRRLAVSFPSYQFGKNKGYGTKDHFKALQAQGESVIHRTSFLKKYTYAQKNDIQNQLKLYNHE